MTILTADDLQDHRYLPDDFARSMAGIRTEGGPWACESCGGPSYLVYRCSYCGNDLAE